MDVKSNQCARPGCPAKKELLFKSKDGSLFCLNCVRSMMVRDILKKKLTRIWPEPSINKGKRAEVENKKAA